MRFTPVTLSPIAGLMMLAVSAQEQNPEPPPRHVRLLAVGDLPPFRQEVRDGVRYEIEPPPGSIPPRSVTIGPAVPDDEASPAVDLRLGRISQAVEIPPGEGDIELRPGGNDPEAAPWLRLKRPASGDFLVVLWRDPTQPTWSAPMGLIVPDGAEGTPAGSVRITNLFQQVVRVAWGDEILTLRPRQSILRMLESGDEVPFQILVADASGALKRYYSGSVTRNARERAFINIYRADGIAPRRPVKVAMLREPVTATLPDASRAP